jgi:hypothetical protein
MVSKPSAMADLASLGCEEAGPDLKWRLSAANFLKLDPILGPQMGPKMPAEFSCARLVFARPTLARVATDATAWSPATIGRLTRLRSRMVGLRHRRVSACAPTRLHPTFAPAAMASLARRSKSLWRNSAGSSGTLRARPRRLIIGSLLGSSTSPVAWQIRVSPASRRSSATCALVA